MDKVTPKTWVPFFWGPMDGAEVRLKITTKEYKIPLPEPGPADFDSSSSTGEIVVPKIRCQRYEMRTITVGNKTVNGMWYVGEEDL